ncbi:ABC transporter permease [Nocardioides marmoriginsengisoli]|uniref:ABC transporter permease n=1 Tax=Nocardioides marmoriginsengisoli TaxID=661483 RepID=A0A3N0CGK7_9ACTN|nr:ABC transporter permease [Nocardioides marmoriginsengisoli]RNL62146.1 ABC transporter permease [Nocardioides marmoriginsengisoli]
MTSTQPTHPEGSSTMNAAGTSTTAPTPERWRPRVAGRWNLIGVPAVLAALVVYFSIASPAFLTQTNLTAIAQRESVMAVAALGATLVIIAGGIDLTMGVVIGATTVAATLPVISWGWPPAVAIVVAPLVGITTGLISGLVVTRLRVPALIATLGMLLAVQGIAAVVSDNTTISGTDLPDWFLEIGRGFVGSVPIAVILAVALYAVGWFVLTRTVFGAHLYATGSESRSARLAGVKVDRVLVAAYVLSGVLASVAGLLLASRLGSGYAAHGTGWEFQIVAAVLLGGTSIFGGSGSVIGTLAGVLLLGVLENGLNLLNVNTFYQTMATGLLLIAAVAISEASRGRRTSDAAERRTA